MFTRVNLYKNCILTARNTEVFRTAELLESYLGTLDKPYTADIDIANVYTTLSGDITIDATPLNGDFNYIKFQEFDDNNQVKQTVYAFIDSFRIVNDLLVISYSTDIWHTYIGKWTLRDSLISNSRYLPPQGYDASLIVPYVGAGKFTYTKTNTSGLYSLVFKAMLYENTSGRVSSVLHQQGWFVYSDYNNGNKDYGLTTTISNANRIMQSMVGRSPQGTETGNQPQAYYRTYNPDGTPNDYGPYFINIEEMYIIPKEWSDNLVFSEPFVRNNILVNAGASNARYGARGLASTTGADNILEETNYIVPEDIVSFGTFTSQIPLTFNNKVINYKVIESCCLEDFHIYLEYYNTTVEITRDFYIALDYEPVTPDVIAQREIARKQGTWNGIKGIVGGAEQVAMGVASMALGGANVATGASLMGATQGVTLGSSMAITQGVGLNTFNRGRMQQVSGGGSIVGGITSIVDGALRIKYANTDKYKSFTSSQNIQSTYINAFFGITMKTIEIINGVSTAINKDEVEQIKNECGYQTDYISNNLDIVNNITDYNIIRFGFVRLTGLSTEICEMITSILMNGVKIWYTANV